MHPSRVQAVMAAFSLDFLSLPSSSCLVGDVQDGFWMYPLLVCGGSLAGNVALVALSRLAAVRGDGNRAATYELVLSLFYALQLTLTWRAAANVMIVLSSGFKEWMESGILPPLATALALLLLLMQAHSHKRS